MISGPNNSIIASSLDISKSTNTEIQNNLSTIQNDVMNDDFDGDDFQARINLVAKEMERRSTNIGYGLGIGLGRILGTEDDNENTNSIHLDVKGASQDSTNLGSTFNTLFNLPITVASNLYDGIKRLFDKSNEIPDVELPTNETSIHNNTKDDKGDEQTILETGKDAYINQSDAQPFPGEEVNLGSTTNSLFNLPATTVSTLFDAYKLLADKTWDNLGYCSTIDDAIMQNNLQALGRLINQGNEITEDHIFAAIRNKSKDVIEYLLNKNLIDLEGKMNFKPLKFALSEGAFEIADLFRKQGAQLKNPVIGVVTHYRHNDEIFQSTFKNLGNADLVPTTINADLKQSSTELLEKIHHYLQNLPEGINRAQAILNSNIAEVETIKKMAELAFRNCDAIWLSDGANVWQGWYDPNYNQLDAQDLYRDILEIAILDLQQKDIYKPLIGVSRGSQMINVFHEGSLKNEGQGQPRSNPLPLMRMEFNDEMLEPHTDRAIISRFLQATKASKEESCLPIALLQGEHLLNETDLIKALLILSGFVGYLVHRKRNNILAENEIAVQDEANRFISSLSR